MKAPQRKGYSVATGDSQQRHSKKKQIIQPLLPAKRLCLATSTPPSTPCLKSNLFYSFYAIPVTFTNTCTFNLLFLNITLISPIPPHTKNILSFYLRCLPLISILNTFHPAISIIEHLLHIISLTYLLFF